MPYQAPDRTDRTFCRASTIVGAILLFHPLVAAVAQIFPADSGSSRWSFSIEPAIGITGIFPDSKARSDSSYTFPDSEDSLHSGIPLIVPQQAKLSYNVVAGIHYHIGKSVSIGFTAGYETRGTTAITVQNDDGFYKGLLVGYCTLGPHCAIGSEKLSGSVGLKYGFPLSATATGYSFTHGQETIDLLGADRFINIPAPVILDLRLAYPVFRFSNHVLSGILLWNATFTKLALPLESDNRMVIIEGTSGPTVSLQLGLNWSFRL